MSVKQKYPRTFHLPWSPGVSSDDKVMSTLDGVKGQEVLVTEKMDGENTTMAREHIHARSIDGGTHPSRDWVKAFWGGIRSNIPDDVRVCGENLFAKHSIHYTNLSSYFLGFSVWEGDVCWSWEDTLWLFSELGIQPVPVIGKMIFEETEKLVVPEGSEGYVVRVPHSFERDQFPFLVGKYVRKNHVQTNEHWMHQVIVKNELGVS
jgi:hypothetical protein